jgi:ATP-dependent RNA helicase DHX29
VHDKYYYGKNKVDWSEDLAAGDEDSDTQIEDVKLERRYSAKTTTTINLFDERLIPYDLIIAILEKLCFQDATNTQYAKAILIFMPGLGEIRRMADMLAEHPQFGVDDDFRVYPLHSTISSDNQAAVFEVPPPGIRKIVIGKLEAVVSCSRLSLLSATNIAETGITIPDVTCVIDTGKHREMRYATPVI